jgi:hypothetical protein
VGTILYRNSVLITQHSGSYFCVSRYRGLGGGGERREGVGEEIGKER